MVKSMIERDVLKRKIEDIFVELGVHYVGFQVDEEDTDLNYSVLFDVDGILKQMNKSKGIIYLDLSFNSINFLAPKVYSTGYSNEDALKKRVKAINDFGLSGRFICINDDSEKKISVYYINRLAGGKEFVNLSKEIIQSQIDGYVHDMEVFYSIFESMGTLKDEE